MLYLSCKARFADNGDGDVKVVRRMIDAFGKTGGGDELHPLLIVKDWKGLDGLERSSIVRSNCA